MYYIFERLDLNLSALEKEYIAFVDDRLSGDLLICSGELTMIDIAAEVAVYFIIKALKIK